MDGSDQTNDQGNLLVGLTVKANQARWFSPLF
jgi:hypothetical protein